MSVSIGVFMFVVAVSDVTSWTVDLPEARKYIFEKNDRLEAARHEERQKTEIAQQIYWSNRYDSNSKHHEKPHEEYEDADSYAKDYGYQSYMEKRVRGIVYDGSEYLGGLQRSIQNFTELLENCTRMNRTNARYWFNATALNFTAFNATSYNRTAPDTSASVPELWRSGRCRRVTRAGEHVRRLAELALKTTKDLQDIAYSRNYMKDDPHDLSKEENELILKLAWFLDQLAYYTDFHPQPKRYLDDDYRTSTTVAPPVANPLNATEETKLMMMNCLKQKSNIPATLRCAYPQEIPGVVQFAANNSNPLPGAIPSPSNREERVLLPSTPLATSEQELVMATAPRPAHPPHRHRAAVTHVQKRSVPEPELLSKRSDENPAITFMKYFVKHKVWENSNPTRAAHAQAFRRYELENELPHRIEKRAADGKKLELPEDPFQDLSKYVKNKKGVSYVKDEAQAQRMRASVQKMLESKPAAAKQRARRIAKLFRSKRSGEYERDVDKPRDPEDLFKDISYYVKNKPGTTLNRDFVQAAQLRAGLAQIFLIPNIQTVRQYAANFNPLVPDPLMLGALRSAADN